jgi:hypothetical protein
MNRVNPRRVSSRRLERQLALLLSLTFALGSGCGRINFGDVDSDSDRDAASGDGSTDTPTDPATFNDITDPTNWSSFTITSVTAGAAGYVGAGFDGRYIYFVPSYNGTSHGIVARYDTQSPFTTAASWQTFDTTTVNADARGFNGGVFDGRYMYFAPHDKTSGFNGVITRYDTQLPFTNASSWSTFDVATVAANAIGFFGARFDGRYIYFVPYVYNTLARYDTQAPFTSSTSWTTLDLSTFFTNVPAFIGAIFDGNYLYLVPFIVGASGSGQFLRYDTTKPLTTSSSWTNFDTTSVTPTANAFCGGAFDGRFIYFPSLMSGTTARLDTQANFTSAASWSAFDIATVNPNAKQYFGATFDGRYITFAPYPGSTVAAYDTTASFTAASAWRTFDVKTTNAQAIGFYGAVFDGTAVYLVPHAGSTAVRFDAKSPPSLPQVAGFGGSFL